MPRDPYKKKELPKGEKLEQLTVYNGQKGIWIKDFPLGTFKFIPGGHMRLEQADGL